MSINHGERLHITFCPKCRQTVDCVPALSRVDGAFICSDCGTREALESMGVSTDEQNEIIEIIHRAQGA
ncbi:MAG: hypothetical protein NC299_08920 [Lachnospiraceae bacterium]|nr:hypothetical protein [Lachnospiraceae bacterium]